MLSIAHGLMYADLNFQGRPRVIAAAVAQSTAGVVVIDPGPSTCLDTLHAALSLHGIAVADIQAILLTHIHLDHAGATGSLVR